MLPPSLVMVAVAILPCLAHGGKLELHTPLVELPDGLGQLHGLAVVIDDQGSAEVSLQQLLVGNETVDAMAVHCLTFALDSSDLHCTGEADFRYQDLNVIGSAIRVRARTDGSEVLASGGWSAGAGEIAWSVHISDRNSTIEVEWRDIALEPWAGAIGLEFSWYGGTATGSLVYRDEGPTPAVTIDWNIAGVSFDSVSGEYAAADLGLTGSAQLGLGQSTAIRASLTETSGELLAGGLYLNLNQIDPKVDLAIDWASGRLDVAQLAVTDPAGLHIVASGSAPEDFASPGDWTVDVVDIDLGAVYPDYFAPLMAAFGFGDYQTSGRIGGRLDIADGQIDHATLDLRGLDLEDAGAGLRIAGIDGLIDYDRSGDALDSQVSWRELTLYKLELGAASTRFYVGADEFSLLEPLVVDVFDGTLQVDVLALGNIGGDDRTVDFEATLTPISLRPITLALGWPEMAGTISGVIPRVRVRGDVVEVGGSIDMTAFDGVITLANLRLERLLGVLPTFAADIELTNIDLAVLTETFSFGAIEGRVDGNVRGLRLLDWEPVAFDLQFGTPEGDKSRHRISQRAVDNLSSIGGGPTALVSSTFLRFFEDFGYDVIGLSCRLRNNRCDMNGAAPAKNGGYYIVKGSGIPRIDVIGYSRKVDFPQLLRRLKAATQGGAPTFGE